MSEAYHDMERIQTDMVGAEVFTFCGWLIANQSAGLAARVLFLTYSSLTA